MTEFRPKFISKNTVTMSFKYRNSRVVGPSLSVTEKYKTVPDEKDLALETNIRCGKRYSPSSALFSTGCAVLILTLSQLIPVKRRWNYLSPCKSNPRNLVFFCTDLKDLLKAVFCWWVGVD